jgi:hypothetical protein
MSQNGVDGIHVICVNGLASIKLKGKRTMRTIVLGFGLFAVGVAGFSVTTEASILGVDFSGYSDNGIGNFGYTLGYDFQVTTPVTVVALAAFDDNSGPGLPQAVAVGLWNASGSLLASTTIAQGTLPTLGMANFFAAASISPITLQPGYYTVAAQDDWVQSLTTLPNFTVASGITYLGYAQTPGGVTALTYPTEQVASGTGEEALFGGNIVIGPVPEPTTMISGAMMLLPFGAGAFRQLRKRLQAA